MIASVDTPEWDGLRASPVARLPETKAAPGSRTGTEISQFIA